MEMECLGVGPTVTRNAGIIGEAVDLNLVHTGGLRLTRRRREPPYEHHLSVGVDELKSSGSNLS